MYEPPQKAFLKCNRKSSKNIIEVLKYWAHIWKDSGRKFGLFWNAVVFGEHLLYESKPDARAKHQGNSPVHIYSFKAVLLMLRLFDNLLASKELLNFENWASEVFKNQSFKYQSFSPSHSPN